MAIVIGGHETGLIDSSLTLLDRNDRTRLSDPGQGEQVFVNVSNGNLSIQQTDAFLPSRGDDFLLLRTYNARGRASDAHQHEDARWTWSTWVRLDVRNDGGEQYFEVEYGDGSFFDYNLDTATGLYVSTDGAGAFETIEDLGTTGNNEPSYVLTRADQSRLSFDSQGRLLSWVDTNDVRIDYVYSSDRLMQVLDDQGHVINYVYQNGKLFQITDETEGVLVEYRYDSGRLSEVIDRFGHSTQYFYTNNGFLERIVLPDTQVVDGQLETYDSREISFQYEAVNWRGNNKASAQTVTQITDAEGGVTTFEYDFQFSTPGTNNTNGTNNGNGKKKGHFKNGKADATEDTTNTNVDKFFDGGTTTMVDALGNNRAHSNAAEYVEWRLDNGYYATYDASLAATDPNFQAQVDAIRQQHSLTYTYRDDGYITEVVDQQGFHTSYQYDAQANLVAVTDNNGWGAVNSDSQVYRELRAHLGVVDTGGNGKLVADLSQAEIDALTEAFTSHFGYDERGNLISSIDNEDNLTTLTYTAFNNVASSTSAVGHALASSDDQFYQDKRVELGYAALAADLSAADVQAILDLHTTFFEYDANQNLVERRDPGGDLTRFAYDIYGNQVQRTVFLDANDLVDPAKQQVTTFGYDALGNNISVTDAEGNQSFSQYDHFGNRTQLIDANGGITTYTYDADDRLLTVTDPEGHVTLFAYDAVGNRISVTDAAGKTVTRIYDRNNNLLATIDPALSNPLLDRISTIEYDVIGNRTATVDAEGRRTEYIFNTRRELVEAISAEVGDVNGNPTMYSSTFAYDGEGNRVRTTNNRGFVTEIFYTQNNLVREQTDPNGHVTRFDYDANDNRVQIVSGLQLPAAKRQILQFSYDEEHQLVTQTDAEGNVVSTSYDAPGNRIAITDGEGNTTDFEYDSNNRLLREIRAEVVDPQSGLPTRYTVEHVFDANGNEIETIDENGNSTRFTFDKDDKLVMVEDANQIKTVFTYDDRENRTSIIIGADATVDVNGQVVINDVTDAQITRFVYDEFNQLVTQVDGLGNALAESDAALYQQLRQELGYAALVADLSAADQQALRDLYTSRFAYDRVGNQVSATDNLGRISQFQYDALNRQTSLTDALGQTASMRYDGNGNLVARVDELGRETGFSYDSVDRLTDTTDPLGVVTRREYDDFGNRISETRAFGTVEARSHSFIYDLNNRLVAQTDPEGNTSSFEYDAVGNRLRVTDGRGNATQFLYDALYRNIKIIDPLGFETRFEYDGADNRLSLIDARGGVSRFDFDPGNRLVSTTDPEGRVAAYAYDPRGNRIELRTAAGTADEQLTLFEYDAENNLRQVVDAEGGVSTNDFDRVYNRIETVDANGNATVAEFDALNRMIRTTDAEGGVSEFVYDAVSNTLTQTDPLGRATSFAYDANNRIISQVTADGVETTFAYDLVGNRSSVTRAANTPAAATDTFVFDLNDRLVEQRDALGNLTRFEYDENDNRTLVTDPNGNTTTYVYDADNRVTDIIDPEGNLVRYDYDGNDNRARITDARGNSNVFYFNGNDEVVLSVDADGYATAFEYDKNGNVVSQTLHMQALTLPLDPALQPVPPAGPDDQTTRFEYDRLNRITVLTDAEGFRTEYSYDAVGNRLQTRTFRDLAGADVAVVSNFYDDINREIAMVTAEGYLVEFAYDAVGNRTQRIVYDERVTIPGSGLPQPVPGDSGRLETFTYDAVNRLLRETSALGVHTDFEYDARGNRTAIVEASGSADQRRSEFSYDTADRVVLSTDALGTETGLTLDGNGNVLERREAQGSGDERLFTFSYDGNNRTVSQTDALGVVTTMAYDGNGNMTAMTRAAGLGDARTETFAYDRNNRLTVEINGEGERSESVYDGAGNRIRLTLAPGLAEERVNSFEFDRDNRLAAGIDGEGVRTEYRYDGAGNKIATIQAAGLAGQERLTEYQYDLDNRLLRITDPMGFVTAYEYDVLGNQVRTVNANGNQRTSSFDVLGRLVSNLSAGGTLTVNTYDLRGNTLSTTQSFADGSDSRTTLYQYDLLDRQTRVTDPEGFSTSIDYDVFGNQVLVTHGQYLLNPGDAGYDADKAARAFPQTNGFSYDAADRLLQLTDGVGNQTTYGYDALGNRASITEAANSTPRTTTFSYDLADRLIETINPEGGISRNRYDETGNLVAEEILQSDDGAGIQVWINRSFEYDGNARRVAEIDGEGVRTEREYDAMGNETVVRAAAGSADERVTRKEYDLNNRVAAEIDGENNRSEFAYDSLGNRIRVTDALGRVARFYFDGANRLISILDAESFVNEFAYDSVGNRIEERVYFERFTGSVDDFVPPDPILSSQDRISTSVYDGNNRSVVRTEADGSRSEFEYDAAGNLLREVQFANTSAPRVLLYSYDLNNRLVEFTDVDGTLTQFAYDGANNTLSETLSNPAEAGVRQTLFVYDLNNRVVSEIFDPAGLNYVQLKVYDKVGNVIANTDPNGNTSTFAYDLNNRVVTQTDPLGIDTDIAYDAVGNQVAVTDGRGFVTEFSYDDNNRLATELLPEASVYTLDGGQQTLRPLVQHFYDAAGNEIQTINANGQITTRYFDSNDRLVAAIDGDNVLREFTYSATGDQLTEILYMTRLQASDHDPAVRPAPPAGEARTTTREYDLAGRVTRTLLPAIEVTTLTNTGTDDPIETRITTQPEERIVYNAFGNAVESFDRNGNRILAWFDARDRQVAVVDAEGYLTEFDFDSQDNVIEQRTYAVALDTSTLSAAVRPTPPIGDVFDLKRTYDAANRLLEERTPLVDIFDPVTRTGSSERVSTSFTYDAVGNQLTRTLAAGSPQALTEYSYYDALNRQVATIDANRVVNFFQYDANGNQTSASRFFNPVAAGQDLGMLDGNTDFAALVGGSTVDDQALARVYDALNRLGSETELMGAGAADDLTRNFRYDAVGNRSYAQDEDGFVQQFSYNAAGQIIKSISPDGSGTVAEFDAAGNQVFLYTGEIDSQAQPAINLGATIGEDLTVNWQLQPGAQVESFLVYDSVSRNLPEDYANQGAVQATWFGSSGSFQIPAGSFAAGDTVFFRVVSRDVAGNLAWTGEQSLTVPPRFDDVVVAQTGADQFTVTAMFEGGAVNQELLFGMPGSATNSVSFVDLGGGLYRATLSGVTNIQELVYQIRWQDGGGQTFTSNETRFEATGGHVGISTTLGETSVMQGGDTLFIVNADVRVPSSLAGDLLVVVGDFEQIGGAGNQGGTSVEGVDSGLGYSTYALALGAGDLLEAGDYIITIRGLTDAGDIVLDRFTVSLGGGTALSGTERGLSWTAPEVGDDLVAIVDGLRVFSERSEGRTLIDAPGAIGTSSYNVFYGDRFADSHDTTVTSTEIFDTDMSTTPPTVTSLGFDLGISTTLSAAESANVSGNLELGWRAAGSGTVFANSAVLAAAGNTYSTTLPLLAAGQYDLKLFYNDADGNEVIVDWLRVDTADASTSESGNSVTVLARETDAEVSLNADEVFDVDPGLYTGPVSDAGLLQPLSLTVAPTGNAGGAQTVDGRDTGYFTENRYDALDNRIATNEETGIWREFGVDANGNVVATYTYGEQGAANPVVTYDTYDGRNRNVARFAAPTEVHGETGERRAVTRFGYDVFDNLVSETDARGNTRSSVYNALGSLLSETDQQFNTRTFGYDRLGNQTRETDALLNNRYRVYDNAGRMIREEDGKGDATTFTYDVFDRRITITNALNQSVHAEFDQRDRQVKATDGLGNDSLYEYDGRDNRTVTIDANGNRFEQSWDALGRVSETISFQNGQQISERNQYDVYGNLIAEIDGEGRVRSSINGAFGRVEQEVDEGGRQTFFEYDRFGNLVRETSPDSGKNIERFYDAANRLVTVNDLTTGVSTTYTYDIAGARKSEIVTTGDADRNRSVSYEYDAIGQMVRWADSVTGAQLNYLWDSAGNLFRAFTDGGYDPEDEGLVGDLFIDHVYSYDANNRVTQITQRAAIDRQFGYDAAGNRVMFNDGSQMTDYAYDANGRVLSGSVGGNTAASWDYDNVGNILDFRTFDENGDQTGRKTSQYYENNRNFFTRDVDDEGKAQETTLTLDRSGRVTRTVLVDDGNSFYFDYSYFADGRERQIRGTGKASGTSTSTYDANDQLVRLDKGRGDTQESNEFLTFVYNNDGQILYRFHDQGQSDETPTDTDYVYANGNPVGETGTDKDGEKQTELDTGAYSLVKNIGEDFPDSAVTFIIASAGDTLQGIAARVYGNPSLWFVIADANGLNGGEALKDGTRLQIPNSVKTGRLTADAHVVYDQGEIVGSTLPNLKSPPPKKKGCGGILAIIIVVVIAVVAVIATAGLATAFLGGATAAASASLGAQIAAFAVAGAIVGAAASIVQQGLFIALGYQDKFSWKSVAAGAVSGLLSGAAQGIGAAVELGTVAASSIKFAKTAARALQVASVASKQIIENGKITSWTSLATAALGPINSGLTDSSGRALSEVTGRGIGTAFNISQRTIDYITPWVELAETAIRNDGELNPGDWASALSSTLNTAFAPSGGNLDSDSVFGGFSAVQQRTVTNLALGGALSLFDKNAGLDFLSNAIGNEVGQFIGQRIVAATGLSELTRVNLAPAQRVPDLLMALLANPLNQVANSSDDTTMDDGDTGLLVPTTSDNPEEGEFKQETLSTADNPRTVIETGAETVAQVLAGGELNDVLALDGQILLPSPELDPELWLKQWTQAAFLDQFAVAGSDLSGVDQSDINDELARTRDELREVLGEIAAQYKLSEDAKQQAWEELNVFEKGLVTVGAWFDSTWEGIKGLGTLAWEGAKLLARGQSAVIEAGWELGEFGAELATNMAAGDWDKVDAQLADAENRLGEAATALGDRGQAFLQGVQTIATLVQDDQTQQIFQDFAGNIWDSTSNATLTTGGVGLAIDVILTIGTGGAFGAGKGAATAGKGATTTGKLLQRLGSITSNLLDRLNAPRLVAPFRRAAGAVDPNAVRLGGVVTDSATDLFAVARGRNLDELTNAQVGDLGEQISRSFLRDNDHTDIFAIQNASGNGIDIVSRTPDGRLAFTEVKSSRTGNVGNLSERQQNMTTFIEDVLSQAASRQGRYRNIDLADQQRAMQMLREYRADPLNVSGNLIGVDLQNEVLRVSPWARN